MLGITIPRIGTAISFTGLSSKNLRSFFDTVKAGGMVDAAFILGRLCETNCYGKFRIYIVIKKLIIINMMFYIVKCDTLRTMETKKSAFGLLKKFSRAKSSFRKKNSVLR